MQIAGRGVWGDGWFVLHVSGTAPGQGGGKGTGLASRQGHRPQRHFRDREQNSSDSETVESILKIQINRFE